MTLDRWRSLIREVEVSGAQEPPCTGIDIERLEVELSVKFPGGYKEFCEVFGSGLLGGFISVFCPCYTDSRTSNGQNAASILGALQGALGLEALQGALGLEALRQELNWEIERQRKGHSMADSTKVALLQKVLPEAFAFGDDPNAHIYLWDLSSYDELDQSCDIYLVPTDDLDGTTLLGKDFFQFVNDFCWVPEPAKCSRPDFAFTRSSLARHSYGSARKGQVFLRRTTSLAQGLEPEARSQRYCVRARLCSTT